MTIREAGNTWNPALAILAQKGYALYCEPPEEEDDFSNFEAHKDGNIFSATNPLALIGLVCIGEELGPDWRQRDTPDLYRDLEPKPGLTEETDGLTP